MVRSCRPDGRQGSGFESPRRGGGGTASLRAPAVAKHLVSAWRPRCQVSRPRPARAPHRAPRLPTHIHRPRTRCPLLAPPLPPLPLAFGRHRAVPMVDFGRGKRRAHSSSPPWPPLALPAPRRCCPRRRRACPGCWARRRRRCGRSRRAHARVCACARTQVLRRSGGRGGPAAHPPPRPATARLPRDGGLCITHPLPLLPPTRIHPNTHLHPHNLLLPPPPGEPSSPTRSRPRMSSRVVVLRPSGGV